MSTTGRLFGDRICVLACLVALLLSAIVWFWRKRLTPKAPSPQPSPELLRLSGSEHVTHDSCLADLADAIHQSHLSALPGTLARTSLALDQLSLGPLSITCAQNDAIHVALDALTAHLEALAARCLRWGEDPALALPVRMLHLQTHLAVAALRRRSDVAKVWVLGAKCGSMKVDAVAQMAAALAADSMEDMSEAACELQVLGLTGHMAYTEWLGKVSGSDGAERLGREAGARLSAKLDALHTQHSLMELQRLSRAAVDGVSEHRLRITLESMQTALSREEALEERAYFAYCVTVLIALLAVTARRRLSLFLRDASLTRMCGMVNSLETTNEASTLALSSLVLHPAEQWLPSALTSTLISLLTSMHRPLVALNLFQCALTVTWYAFSLAVKYVCSRALSLSFRSFCIFIAVTNWVMCGNIAVFICTQEQDIAWLLCTHSIVCVAVSTRKLHTSKFSKLSCTLFSVEYTRQPLIDSHFILYTCTILIFAYCIQLQIFDGKSLKSLSHAARLLFTL